MRTEVCGGGGRRGADPLVAMASGPPGRELPWAFLARLQPSPVGPFSYSAGPTGVPGHVPEGESGSGG